jgi:hypothetical protein
LFLYPHVAPTMQDESDVRRDDAHFTHLRLPAVAEARAKALALNERQIDDTGVAARASIANTRARHRRGVPLLNPFKSGLTASLNHDAVARNASEILRAA